MELTRVEEIDVENEVHHSRQLKYKLNINYSRACTYMNRTPEVLEIGHMPLAHLVREIHYFFLDREMSDVCRSSFFRFRVRVR